MNAEDTLETVRQALIKHSHKPELGSEVALAIIEMYLERRGTKASEEPVKPSAKADPAWFYEAENGQQKLSEAGLEHLFDLFDQGTRIYTASKELGISFGGAKHRYAQWQKLVEAGKRPNAKRKEAAV